MAVLNLKYCKEALVKNEDRIILIIGFILIAFLSFGAGKLSETYHPQTPIIFQNAPHGEAVKVASGIQCNTPGKKTTESPVGAETQTQGRIIGNKKSMIYHVPEDAFYDKIGAQNRIYFNSEAEAQKAGYRKSRQ